MNIFLSALEIERVEGIGFQAEFQNESQDEAIGRESHRAQSEKVFKNSKIKLPNHFFPDT